MSETKTATTAPAVRRNVKIVKVTAEFFVPVSATASLGGKSKNDLTKEERYAAFYVRAAIRTANGRIISQE